MSKQRIILGSLAVCLLAWLITSHDFEGFAIAHAHAQAADSTTTASGVIAVLAPVIAILQYILFIMVRMMEYLLDPKLTLEFFSAAGGANPLLSLWQISRNLTNVCFAFILIIGAVYTIIMGDSSLIKQSTVKFVLAVVLVNFSWFIPRITLDVANVLATSIYAMPNATSIPCKAPDPANPSNPPVNCKDWDVVLFDPSVEDLSDCTDVNGGTALLGGAICYTTKAYDPKVSSILVGMFLNHANAANLSTVAATFDAGAGGATLPEQVINLLRLTIQIGFRFVLLIGLFFPILAMFIAFIARIPILWLTIGFMPFAFIGFVVGDKMGNLNSKKIWDTFLSAAFLPAIVAIPLAAGFILMNAGMTWWNSPPPTAAALGAQFSIPFINGIATMWQLLWMIMTFGVLWIGTFTALESFSWTANITRSIRAYGKEFGKLALAAPLAVPLPVPGGNLLLAPGTAYGKLKQRVYGPPGGAAGAAGAAGGSTPVDTGNRLKTNIGVGNLPNFQANVINKINTDAAHATNPLDDVAMRELVRQVKAAGGDHRNFDHVRTASETAMGGVGLGLHNTPQMRTKFNQWLASNPTA